MLSFYLLAITALFYKYLEDICSLKPPNSDISLGVPTSLMVLLGLGAHHSPNTDLSRISTHFLFARSFLAWKVGKEKETFHFLDLIWL